MIFKNLFRRKGRTINSPLGRAVLEGAEADLAIEGTVLYRNGQPTETGRFLREMLERI
jgi:hypothetical protein